jgi:hypothetical protein
MDLGRQEQETAIRLNLGCGRNKAEGFVNVDKFGDPDVRWDLEQFPWPWPDSSVDEVKLIHVLEHLGQAPATFIGVMQELYRVCRNGARVFVHVPHPRHDNFLGDPTHVRVVTPQLLSLFSRKECERWQAEGAANTPLALYHGVDFEVRDWGVVVDRTYEELLSRGAMTKAQLQILIQERNNVAVEYHIELEVVK